MAFTGITATEAQIDQKSGVNVSVGYTDVMKTAALLMAEGVLNCATRYNWSDAFVVPLNADVLSIISDTTASLVAMEAIKYDMSGYTSRAEAESMVNILRDTVLRNIGILREIKSQTFAIGA